ncbi:MAG: hypothetical protein L3J71_14550 [Victivallaceae bacterium]|nr:hypothetical protein [Victivallaceae bacterium]
MKTLTKLAVLFIITMIYGNAFTQTHPFMLCNESMYDELRARASQEPWSSMKSEALIGVNSTFPSSGTAYEKHYAIRKITMCGALAYILDPANKVTYAHKVRDALLKWDETRLALAAIGVAWDEIVPPGSSYVTSIIAMDIIYNDLTASEISSITEQLDRARTAFYGWPLNAPATVLTHDIFTGRETSAYITKYHNDIDELIRPSGVFHEGTGYIWSRVMGDSTRGPAKAMTTEVLRFTGMGDIDYRTYPRLQKCLESAYVIGMTPFKMNTYFGDSNSKDLRDFASCKSLAVSLYSEKAGHYNAWRRLSKTQDYDSYDILYTYIVLTPAMLNITPETPKSDIFLDNAAGFWENNANDSSLMSVLWNIKDYGYTIWTHGHFENNAIHISAYGENVIRNAGDSLYTWSSTFGSQGKTIYQNCVTVNGINHNSRYGAGVTEGFTGGLVEYASGDTGTAITGANHLRNFIMVHPQDNKPGYFVTFDTVTRENNGDSFEINWHSDSNDCTAISTDTEYRWNVIKRYSNNDVTMNIFLGTAPDSVSIKDAPMMTSRYDGYVVKYIEGKYSVNSSLKKNIVTILFPSDSTHTKANMTRITGSEYSGAKIDNGDGIVDYALESSTANDVLYNNVSFNGAAALYRFNNNDLSFYFVKDGINFDNDSVPRVGFSSTADVTLYMDATEGNIVSTGADVTFYYPAITGVEVDGIAKTVIASGADWVRVNIQSGTYDISLETGIYVPPDGIIMTYLTAVGQNHAYVLTESDSTEPIYVEYGTSTSYGMTASTEDYEQASINYVHNVRLTN